VAAVHGAGGGLPAVERAVRRRDEGDRGQDRGHHRRIERHRAGIGAAARPGRVPGVRRHPRRGRRGSAARGAPRDRADKTLGDPERAIQALPPEGREHYAGALRAFHRRAYQRERSGSSPDVVARAIHHALTAARPRIRYPVGQDARLLVTLPRVLPDRWLDEIRIRLFGLPRGKPVLDVTR
jgi:hypothetical protein